VEINAFTWNYFNAWKTHIAKAASRRQIRRVRIYNVVSTTRSYASVVSVLLPRRDKRVHFCPFDHLTHSRRRVT